MAATTSSIGQQEASGSDLVDSRYRLIGPLPDSADTRGDSPTTWSAYDERLDRYVVLELVSTDRKRTGAEPAALRDLLADDRAASPAVLDAGVHPRPDGTYFYLVLAPAETGSTASSDDAPAWGPGGDGPLSVGVWELADPTAKSGAHRAPALLTRLAANARRTRQALASGAPNVGPALGQMDRVNAPSRCW